MEDINNMKNHNQNKNLDPNIKLTSKFSTNMNNIKYEKNEFNSLFKLNWLRNILIPKYSINTFAKYQQVPLTVTKRSNNVPRQYDNITHILKRYLASTSSTLSKDQCPKGLSTNSKLKILGLILSAAAIWGSWKLNIWGSPDDSRNILYSIQKTFNISEPMEPKIGSYFYQMYKQTTEAFNEKYKQIGQPVVDNVEQFVKEQICKRVKKD